MVGSHALIRVNLLCIYVLILLPVALAFDWGKVGFLVGDHHLVVGGDGFFLSSLLVIFIFIIVIGVYGLYVAVLFRLLVFFIGFFGARLGVSCFSAAFVLVCFTYALSLLFFPTSHYSYIVEFLKFPWFFFLLGSGLLLAGLIRWLWLQTARRALGLGVVVATFVLLNTGAWRAPTMQSEQLQPNLILVGVDSLSMAAFEKHGELLPSIAYLLDAGQSYSRAYSNLGRTYPAWVTLLSGQYPQDNGAFFNLRELSHSANQDLLSHQLQAQGYHSVFALDERRFNNMDQRFGFDRAVGPKPGVLDFVMPMLTDNPLANLLLQMRFSQWLFPWSWNNVAAVSSYSADGFVDDVLRAVSLDKPNLLAVHFESSHFPYKTRHASLEFEHENTLWARYIKSLHVVDGQVGRLMQGLSDRGMLEDALVVLLADHGEAIGLVEARVETPDGPVEVSSYGHGANLLSDHQNRIVLGVVQYKHGEPVGERKTIDQQVSLVDVRPAIERFLEHGDSTIVPTEECTIVETGLRMPALENYTTLNEMEVARQGAAYYQVSGGLMHLREEFIGDLVRLKDIGLRCADRITWFAPQAGKHHAYALDEKGMPSAQIKPLDDDIERIARYRNNYKAM